MHSSFKVRDLGSTQLYNRKFLSDKANSSHFLKAIAYDVNMSSLLKVVKTCTYHQSMEYCPVLLYIESKPLQEYFGGEYMLQVYNSSGKCVFDKILHYDVVSWNIFFDYFVFKLDDREEKDGGWFYIVKFKEGKISVTRIKDIFNDSSFRHIGLSQKHLFLANDREIKIINFKSSQKDQDVRDIVPQPGQFTTYTLSEKNKLHGFFENKDSHENEFLLLIIESSTHIIDFAKMTFVGGDEKVSNIEFQQYREVVSLTPSQITVDPIRYFKQYINSLEKSVVCTYRDSGRVDFYYDYEFVDSTTEFYEKLEMNSKYIYLKKRGGNGVNDEGEENETVENCIEIDQESAQRIGESVGVDRQLDPQKWHFVQYDLIRNHARIYTAITLVNVNFFVAFNQVVAIYDVVRKEWKSHFFFKQQVFGLLRNQISNEMHELNVGVLLENGEIQLIDTPKTRNSDWTLNTTTKIKVEGKILRTVSDWRDISSHYILSQLPNGKRILSGFQRNTISDLTSAIELKDEDELIRCITPNEQEDFMLLNKKDKIIRTYTNTASRNSDIMIVKRHRKIKILENEKIQEGEKTNIDKLGKLEFHSAVGSKENDHLLLFNRFDLIKLKIQANEQTTKEKKAGNSHIVKEITEMSEYNIQNLQVIDSDYCYSLSNESPKQGRPGFYIQNVAGFITTKAKEASNFKLKAAVVGQNDLLDYYKDDQRIAYISSYDVIRIVPLLHRTVLGFIGMRPRNEYLAFRKFRDRLIALDKLGALTSWSVTTGKVLEQKTHNTARNYSEDFNNYEIYQNGPNDITYLSEWYQQRVLLVNKKEPELVDHSVFYGDRLKSELGVNSSYVNTIEKNFYRFRMIEILESQEVIEHFSFIHPYYGDDKFQRLFFSDDLEYMLERHEQNVILYKKVTRPRSSTKYSDTESQVVTWNIVNRIKRFPFDLASCTFVNYLFSPNLMYYLDYNKTQKSFVIKRSMDGTDYIKIPSGLMNPGDGKDISLVGKKFQWLSNDYIRVINNDGIEKTVDITKDCDQISYCSVPMLDLEYLKKVAQSHYFYDMSITKENQTIERLRRKYQEYFTAYCSNGLRDPVDLYNILFEVDFNIDGCKGKVVADTSFTYFHWKIAELMQSIPRFNIKRYHPEEIKVLALNIFPQGNTVLHFAYKNLHIVQRFYKVIDNELKKAAEVAAQNEDGEGGMIFEIPFMKNFAGNTPLHLCIDGQNIKSADIILQKLCNDPIDSHARAINDLLPRLVENELPSLGTYLDSRFGQTKLLKEFRRGAIIKENDLEYAITTAELWPDKHALKGKVFDKSAVDTEVKLEFLDICGVHCYTEPISAEFFNALAETEHLSLFGHRSIQAIIDFKWPLAKEYTNKVLFMPFVVYLGIFVAWSNAFNGYLYPYTKDTWYEMWVADKILCAFLLFFSVYFMTNEVRQAILSGFGYLSSFWNYVDFMPSTLIICIVSIKLKIQYFDEGEDPSTMLNLPVLSSFHSLASFLMWLKLLYFMRIYKQTGYLVKIITECVKDMKVFLLIFLTVIIAFNEAFQRLSEASGEEAMFNGKNWAQGYAFTFALAIGDTRADLYDDSIAPAIVWIIFCMVLLIMNVVMLNLLVAIISKSFEDINENWEQTMYQERAAIIAENGYLIPYYRRKQHCADKDQYLLVAREVLEEENGNDQLVEQVQNKINEIEVSLNDFKKEYREVQEEFSERITNQLTEIATAVVRK